jgi:predicted nuclease of restriction endonuclease-like (RecB) superfamily
MITATSAPTTDLFTRVTTILDTARERVVRSVNQETISAYWLIGREIVEALQSGESRAVYGKKLISELSEKLVLRYGTGFSSTNLEYFRRFYLAFPLPVTSISHPLGGKSFQDSFESSEERSLTPISHALRGKLETPAFQPSLIWTHYRAIMRVEDPVARAFYEQEAASANWSSRDLERQIATQFYERILSSKDKPALLASANQERQVLRPIDVLKDPMILEFLNLPDSAALHESDLEQAIVGDIQRFLLELCKGFSFVARQQRLRFDDKDFYVDLVFYNYLLRCFVLVDLKIGELTHQDIGQMDGYVRMIDEQHKSEGHNPTLGLVLCSQKNAAVARYSVLQGSQQLFASKYLMYLPTEEQLSREIERQRALIEDRLSARAEHLDN